MRCCHCTRQIEQKEIDNGSAHEIFGAYSHKACDEAQLIRQEKLVKYGKNHAFETEQL